MKLWFFFLMVSALAHDHYVLQGDYQHRVIYQHENMLLIKHMKQALLVEQPGDPEYSHLLDVSDQDLILSLHKNSYAVVRQDQDALVINCYHQTDPLGKFHILLDAGHGGKDAGAISKEGLKEKHVTLSFCNKLKKHLEHPLIKLSMVRTQDVFIDKYDRLKQVLVQDPNLLLSIHADAYEKDTASGVGLFYLDQSKGSALSQSLIKNSTVKKDVRLLSRDFANSLLNRLQKDYKLHIDKALSLPLVILRSPKSLSILLELGFLSNTEEAKLLANEHYLEGFAEDLGQHLLEMILAQQQVVFVMAV